MFYELVCPFALALVGLVAFFKLSKDGNEPMKATFRDIVLLIIAVGCLVGGVVWALNILGYQPNPYNGL